MIILLMKVIPLNDVNLNTASTFENYKPFSVMEILIFFSAFVFLLFRFQQAENLVTIHLNIFLSD